MKMIFMMEDKKLSLREILMKIVFGYILLLTTEMSLKIDLNSQIWKRDFISLRSRQKLIF